AAIWTKQSIKDRFGMPDRRAQRRAGNHIPCLSGPVITRGEQPAAIRTKPSMLNASLMTNRCNCLAGLGIENPGGAVAAGDRHPLAIGTEFPKAGVAVLSHLKAKDLLPAGNSPNGHRLRCDRQDAVTVRAETDIHSPGVVLQGGTDPGSSRCIPQ